MNKDNKEKKEKIVYYFEKEPTLKKIQEIVNGYITIIYLSNNRTMYVNEDGILLKLPLNKEASKLAGFEVYGKAIVIKN
ncbi:MAG: hypothetical protein CMQ53_04970 [Gammaproteobacteria bacterium]|nr:hypothetical protein [Gammaproteobacteria bacterium]